MSHLGEFEQVVLFCVHQLDPEASGVAIRDQIESRTGRLVSSGAVYTTLGRLEKRNLISATIGEPTPNRRGRPQKFYSVEPAGARALLIAYNTIQTMAGDSIPSLTKLAEG